MNHTFNVDIAEKYGLEEAILVENIVFWCVKNWSNKINIYKGKAWTYNSLKAFQDMFPYLGVGKIRSALENLETNGLIETGQFSTRGGDRTKWYSLTETTEKIYGKQTGGDVPFDDSKDMERKEENAAPRTTGEDGKVEKTAKRRSTVFKKPTIEEIEAYCRERKNGINAVRFFDFYESRGWFMGKTKMKNWQAAVRTWEECNKQTECTGRTAVSTSGIDTIQPQDLNDIPF